MLAFNWTREWAWPWFRRLALLGDEYEGVDVRKRWQIVWWSLRPMFSHYVVSPAKDWVQRRLPRWLALTRLEARGSGWYRVPDMGAALHVWRRFGVTVLEDDYIKVKGGVVVARGFEDEDQVRCEFWHCIEGD